MASIVKALEPVMKLASRAYQGAVQTELNKMGEFDERQWRASPLRNDKAEKLFVTAALRRKINVIEHTIRLIRLDLNVAF